MTFLDDRLIAECGLELARVVDSSDSLRRNIRPCHTVNPDEDFADEFDDEGFTLADAVWN